MLAVNKLLLRVCDLHDAISVRVALTALVDLQFHAEVACALAVKDRLGLVEVFIDTAGSQVLVAAITIGIVPAVSVIGLIAANDRAARGTTLIFAFYSVNINALRTPEAQSVTVPFCSEGDESNFAMVFTMPRELPLDEYRGDFHIDGKAMYIANATQRAKLKVDAEGAAAEAITEILFELTKGMKNEEISLPIPIIFDRPFLFTLWQTSGEPMPIFAGTFRG